MNRALALLATVVALALALGGATAAGRDAAAPVASGYDFVKFPTPACAGTGLRRSPYFTRNDCGFAEVRSTARGERRRHRRADRRGRQRARHRAGRFAARRLALRRRAGHDWPAGPVTVDDARRGPAGGRQGHVLRQPARRELARATAPTPGDGDPRARRGVPAALGRDGTQRTGAARPFRLRVVDADGEVAGTTVRAFTPPTTGPSTPRCPAGRPPAWSPAATRTTARRSGSRRSTSLRRRRPARRRFWAAPDGVPAGSRRGRRGARRARAGELVRLLAGLGQAGRDVSVPVRVENYRRRAVDRRGGRGRGAGRHHARPDAARWNVRATIPAAAADGARRRREGVRGEGRHARPGPADRLEGPLDHRDADLRGRPRATRRATARR